MKTAREQFAELTFRQRDIPASMSKAKKHLTLLDRTIGGFKRVHILFERNIAAGRDVETQTAKSADALKSIRDCEDRKRDLNDRLVAWAAELEVVEVKIAVLKRDNTAGLLTQEA